ncbi:MAG: hypothetical protein AUH29_03195 [Candidatus Rokubacteria bacterium 13_1_40CM_69_27]|nr:MAG: hypothetical protein AUH29_03195 [Candidatus Rokubacteria bacterium 13_1_40CM_69_27]OLC31336.1 MAG: hypothetical protein AUH81_18170 [Candidatus Rokubacteria bacterium 13_1_40CM_4_69_5]
MIVFVAALALGATPALAVHTSPLEIDGDVIPFSAQDWQTLFFSGGVFNCSTTAPGGTATSKTCVSERLDDTASIFTGGGSKDGLDIPFWAGKEGSVPDKDNLVTAFAARYTSGTDQILYFGGDRFATNGDAQIGFWFFQDNVQFNPSTGTFSGNHQVNDILILSNFTQGGTLTNIQALLVTAISASGDLSFTTIASASAGTTFACNGPDTICAATNAGTTPSLDPNYKDKANTPAGTYPPVAFFEGGLNLSAFNLGGECFASFLMETRSSQSITAVLKDFVGGAFQPCQAGIVTHVRADSNNADLTNNNNVAFPTPLHDQALVTGTPGVATPTGTVTFEFFDNLNCDPANFVAQESGTLSQVIAPTATTGGVAEALSPSRTPNPGPHSYHAKYNGDSRYPATGFSMCEPFTVAQVPSGISTFIADPITGADLTNQALNTNSGPVSVVDKATVTCGIAPTGGVTFTFFNNATCTGSGTVDNCGLAGGCPLNASGVATSGTHLITAGVFSFNAVYNGDFNCLPSATSSCEPVCGLPFLTHP